jgi:hypothetical protein
MKNWILGLVVVLCGCGEVATSPEQAVKTAETMGWSNVRVTERHGMAPSLYGCSDKDVVAYEISGKNPRGDSAAATVCCGWPFKGCTMRIP